MAKHLSKDHVSLELDKILDRLTRLTNNPLSRELVAEMELLDDIADLAVLYAENQEAMDILRLAFPLPTLRFADIRPHLERVRAGGSLDLVQLSDVLNWLSLHEDFYLASQALEGVPLLAEYAKSLTSFSKLRERCQQIVDEDQKMKDRASAKLYGLRRASVTMAERIKRKMQELVQSSAGKKLLQDQLITMRSNRYVVPLKAENKSKIPGIVHDQSATGATIYVEPSFAVELNNSLQQNKLDQAEEVRRILREISNYLASQADDLLRGLWTLARVDLIMARGRLALEMDGTAPLLNEEGIVYLKAARHPLIEGRVVANDIVLGKDYRSVIITGPNTGGKTVVLKTLGLLALMAKMGLFLPCDGGSKLAVFDRIFADIGDEQSIEQSLSTYSSHMKNIIRITRQVSARSLVLLDELGAGTDPSEGAALAASLIEFFNKKEARTMATTHYGELKIFAYDHDQVTNASVEFDHETLRPTFRLLMGTPGLSNALTIASSLGLSEGLIDRAKAYISQDELRVSQMLEDLEDKRKRAEAMGEETETLRQEVADLKAALASQESRLEEKKRRTMEAAYDQAEDILQAAKREAEEIVASFKKSLKGSDKADLLDKANRMRDKLKSKNEAYKEKKKGYEKKASLDLSAFKPGDRVRVRGLSQKADLLSLDKEKGEASLQVGIMKMTVPLADLEATSQEASSQSPATARAHLGRSRQASSSVDLRGMTAEEAQATLDKYLDDVLLSSLSQVRIIHGKGTGALQAMTKSYLAAHPSIGDYHYAQAQEGGSGVTVAKLK